MSYRLIAAAAAAVALQGCASQPPPAIVATEDLNIGIAAACTASPVQPTPGGTTSASITMTNDGGWCAVRLTEADGQPFSLGLIRTRPEHGTMLVQKLGGQTRLEYTPNRGFAGKDAFTAALRSHAGAPDTMLQVAVTVERGAGMPEAVAPSSESKPATPARRSTTRATTRRSSSSSTR